MTVTIFFPLALALAAFGFLLRDRIGWLFFAFVISMAFGGSAVLLLPLLGGASVLVCHLLFLCLVASAIATAPSADMSDAVRLHATGLLLAGYALLCGYFGPRLFGGADVLVVPMRNAPGGAIPLVPQGSNVTHSLYFLGSIVLATIVTALFRSRLTFQHLRYAVLALSALHAAFGIAEFGAAQIGLSGIFDVLRNASYGMLAQELNGIPRISGAFPEPSSYAMLCIPLVVFCAELWLQKGDRASGVIALALVVGVALSLSTAGLFGVAVYLLILAVRTLSSFRSPEMFARLLALLFALLLVAALAVAVVTFNTDGVRNYTDVLSFVTVDKLDSSSANERSGWATQGLNLFVDSMGFGVGAGSFRSSSILTAIAGSFGIAGVVLMSIYIWSATSVLFRPGRDTVDNRICAWAAIGALIPQLVVGVTPDPGFVFALFAAVAIARPRSQAVTVAGVPGLAR